MNVLVGFFQVPDVGPITVETELTGNGRADHESLWKQVREKHPKVENITRTGSTIETRDDKPKQIEYHAGALLKNLFDREETKDECSIRLGTVLFHGESNAIVLRYHRAKGTLGINLVERAQKTTTRFSDSIPAMRLVKELPLIVKEVLGPGAKNVELWLNEVAPSK